MTSKADEAQQLIEKADKCLKTSLFKRTPDYDSAIEYIKKAAILKRNAQALEASAKLYEQLADLYYKNKSLFHAAKSNETASHLYREMKQYDKVVSLIDQAGQWFRENGTPDTAAYTYQRTASSLEAVLPEKAAYFHAKAAEACEVEDKYHEAVDHATNAGRQYLRAGKMTEAEQSLRKAARFVQLGNPDCEGQRAAGLADSSAVPHLVARLFTRLFVMKLSSGDQVAARKVIDEACSQYGFASTSAFGPTSTLLTALEQRDGDVACKAIKSPVFTLLEVDYNQLLRNIKLPASKPPPVEATSSGGGDYQGGEDEDSDLDIR